MCAGGGAAVFDEIERDAERIRGGGRAGPATLARIGRAKSAAAGVGRRWLEGGGGDCWYYYQAVRRAECIMERMGRRFAAGEGAGAAEAALAVLPHVRAVVEAAEAGCGVDEILRLTVALRRAAAEADLLGDEILRETVSVGREAAGRAYDRAMERIGIPIRLPAAGRAHEGRD